MTRKSTHPDPEDIRRGETLRAIREASGLRVGETALGMGISSPYLSNIEAGRKRLSPSLAHKAAAILNCRPVALLRPDEFPNDARRVS